jgi:hypothetical protein
VNQKGFCFIGIGLVRLELIRYYRGAALADEFRLEFLDDRPTFPDIFGRTSKNDCLEVSFGAKAAAQRPIFVIRKT